MCETVKLALNTHKKIYNNWSLATKKLFMWKNLITTIIQYVCSTMAFLWKRENGENGKKPPQVLEYNFTKFPIVEQKPVY